MSGTPYGYMDIQIPKTHSGSSKHWGKIRGMIGDMEGVVQIKDNIVIHGKGKEHDEKLKELLDRVQNKG